MFQEKYYGYRAQGGPSKRRGDPHIKTVTIDLDTVVRSTCIIGECEPLRGRSGDQHRRSPKTALKV